MLRRSRSSSPRRSVAAIVSLALITVVALLVVPSARAAQRGGSAVAGAAAVGMAAGDVVELLPIQTADRRIVDTAGRDVLLRGANVNSLGEYWQGVPTIEPTIPLTDADWDLMAARGFSVVRLLITWSRVEPTRDVIDQGYLDQVEAAVDDAAERGIYTVIDMHQDAYSAFISTTDPATCPPGTTPAKGWDGAPAWATLTDGLSTCLLNSERNSSPAVNRAWNNFYDNVDGIRDEFVEAWAAVATRFAGRPEVAGYDLLNEPENPRPAAELQPLYDALLADLITAIRAAEGAAPFDHVIFVTLAVPTADLSRGLVIPSVAPELTTNVSITFHNYAEAILPGVTIEQINALVQGYVVSLNLPNWGGEYGFWDTEPATLAKAVRYAADEDRLAWGGAWWQWRQSCGDPHAVRWSDGEVVAPTGTEVHLNLLGCPGNDDLGPNDAFLDILGRGYPRATPGRITELVSDPATGHLRVAATADDAGGELLVWTPTVDSVDHRVHTVGLTDVVQHAVPGGRLITATVVAPGAYELAIGPGDEDPVDTSSSTSTTADPTSTSTTDPTAPTTSAPSTSTTGPTSTTDPTAPTTTAPGTPTGVRPGSGSRPGAAPAARPVSRQPAYTG